MDLGGMCKKCAQILEVRQKYALIWRYVKNLRRFWSNERGFLSTLKNFPPELETSFNRSKEGAGHYGLKVHTCADKAT